jgi:hypothetical protein
LANSPPPLPPPSRYLRPLCLSYYLSKEVPVGKEIDFFTLAVTRSPFSRQRLDAADGLATGGVVLVDVDHHAASVRVVPVRHEHVVRRQARPKAARTDGVHLVDQFLGRSIFRSINFRVDHFLGQSIFPSINFSVDQFFGRSIFRPVDHFFGRSV